MLIDHLLKSQRAKENPEKCCIFYSTVSSSFAKTLSKTSKFEYGETLTGFKFLGECMIKAENENKIPLLAFEESLGFLVGTHVYDKDGVSAALVFSEIAESCYQKQSTMSNYLMKIMERYGYHVSFNKYYKVSVFSI